MRTFAESQMFEEHLLTEWAEGNTYNVLDKIFKVVTKKTGLKFSISPYPNKIQNEYGTFLAYDVGMTGHTGKRRLRLNFDLGASAELANIDMWKNPRKQFPLKTLKLNGFGIVKTFEQVLAFLQDRLEYATVMEAVTTGKVPKWEDVIAELFDSDAAFQRACLDSNGPDFNAIATVANAFMKSHGGNKQVDMAGLPKRIKTFLLSRNLGSKASNVPVATVVPPPKKTVVYADPERAKFAEVGAITGPKQLLDKFKRRVRFICAGVEGFYMTIAYGKGGVGKDHIVAEIAREEGTSIYMPTIAAGAKIGLATELFNHRTNEVIVLSDNGAYLKDQTSIDILKIAFDNKPSRTITLPETSAITDPITKDKVTSFEFTSRVIFLSNNEALGSEPGLDAIRSRAGKNAGVFPLLFTDREILEYIGTQLDSIKASGNIVVPLADKQELWDFLYGFYQDNADTNFDVDFRTFMECLVYQRMFPNDKDEWKQYAYDAFNNSNRKS